MARKIASLIGLALLALYVSQPKVVGANLPRVSDQFTFGLYVKNESFEELRIAEEKAGRRADVFLMFKDIGDEFDAERTERLIRSGYTVVLTLKVWEDSLAAITRGDLDNEFDRWARDIADFGYPLVLRPLHEFNGNWFPWGVYYPGNQVEDFTPAWRHIVNRFRTAGANNVSWQLCFNRYHPEFRADPWTNFWPGEEYVDIIGIDIFNRPPDESHTWQDFDTLFEASYQQALTLPGNKPIWLQEFGSTGQGGDKAAWIRDTFQSIRTRYPRIASVTWFNYALVRTNDWAFDQTPATLAAFREAIQPPKQHRSSAGGE